MKVLRNLTQSHDFKNGVVAAIGNFDGVHLGHKSLLSNLQLQSIKKKLPILVIIFEPQPREFFTPNYAPSRISPLRDKLKLLEDFGVDYVLCLRFNKKLANMSASAFARKSIFEVLHAKYLLVGKDFRFGKNRQGDFALLAELGKEYHCEVKCHDDYLQNNQKVSSTLIRQFLVNAEFESATQLLGRQYTITGRVVHGQKQARKWGVPTANLRITQLPLVLKGVYCVQIKLETGIILPGVANIGHRPTIDGTKQVLEVHILNFIDSLYGELLEVVFLKKLRDEQKFSSLDELVTSIKKDVTLAKEYFLIQ